jgi:quinol-cytochrome oxidoreductase complex cytochrome b subunit
MALQLNLDKETVRQILSGDLGMRTVSSNMVPRLMTDYQASSDPNIDYWNGTTTIPLIWLQMLSVSFQKLSLP